MTDVSHQNSTVCRITNGECGRKTLIVTSGLQHVS
jgi:hypothetical protein